MWWKGRDLDLAESSFLPILPLDHLLQGLESEGEPEAVAGVPDDHALLVLLEDACDLPGPIGEICGMPIAPPNYSTLTAMITPALFMTATGSLIISTSNRMSRIVDRIRQLNEQADNLSRGKLDLDFPGERLEHIAAQLDRLVRRSDRIREALTLLYLALALFVGTSLTTAIHALIGSDVLVVPTALAIAGVTLLLLASVQLTREAHAALRGNRLEIHFYEDLRRRRAGG